MSEDVDCLARMAALETEVAQLRHAVTAHATVDQAMGVVSQRTNTKLREVAEHIRQWSRRDRLPEEIHRALDEAVRARTDQAPQARV